MSRVMKKVDALPASTFSAFLLLLYPCRHVGGSGQLQQAKIYLNTPDLFAWTLVIVLVSLVFEKVFLILLKWGERTLERM